MDAWSESTSNGQTLFTDMSYVTKDPTKNTSAVYVCVEKRGQDSCPSETRFVMSEGSIGDYHFSVSQEIGPDQTTDRATFAEWRDVAISMH